MTWNPIKRGADEDAQVQITPTELDDNPTGKGRPTPKRKQVEAENLRPIVPKDRKASRKVERDKMREKQNEEYDAMRNGDVRHMPVAERIPARVYIRDYIDARWNLAEFFIPVAFVILLGSMAVTAFYPQLSMPLLILMYAYLIAAVIDIALMWRKLKAKLVEKYGEGAVSKGSRSATYAWSRALQLRRWRMPRPRSPKRGNWPK
ncbi:MAG: DUF3043 domain-containing protein [Bifidobacterium crudilactis]|nr:DUF3043 domain-containing protein [Bifidobacterium crudilactis]